MRRPDVAAVRLQQAQAGRLADDGEIGDRAVRDRVPGPAAAATIQPSLALADLRLLDLAADAGEQMSPSSGTPERLTTSAACRNDARPPFML